MDRRRTTTSKTKVAPPAGTAPPAPPPPAPTIETLVAGAIETLKKEFSGLRTGRASPALLDPVRVEAYGNMVPVNQVGNISTPEPRMITVQVWDRGLVLAVEKAIRDSNLGLNPQTDGQLVRIPIP